MGSWNIYLPIKPTFNRKTRFENWSSGKRSALAKAMAIDVINCLLLVEQINSITIVGVDHKELVQSNDPKVESFIPSKLLGINSDVTEAVKYSQNIAVLLPDIPAITGLEITTALMLAENQPESFIADKSEQGSTFYAALQRQNLQPAFGLGSALKHANQGAYKLDHECFIGIRSDCDNLMQLLSISPELIGPATKKFLQTQKKG